MTSIIPDAELNALADYEASRWSFVSLHTATPTAGAAEATGGSPAYARKAPTFGSAGAVGPLGATAQPATAGIAWSDLMTFDVAAGTYTAVGGWSLVTAGVFRGGHTLSSSIVRASQDTAVISIGVGPVAAGA